MELSVTFERINMLRDVRVGLVYFVLLTVGAILAGALIEFVVTLFKWIEVLLLDGSAVRANIAAQLQREKMAGSNFSSELFVKALWGWALCLFSYCFRFFNGRWPHE
jgi:hypothetical protein